MKATRKLRINMILYATNLGSSSKLHAERTPHLILNIAMQLMSHPDILQLDGNWAILRILAKYPDQHRRLTILGNPRGVRLQTSGPLSRKREHQILLNKIENIFLTIQRQMRYPLDKVKRESWEETLLKKDLRRPVRRRYPISRQQ